MKRNTVRGLSPSCPETPDGKQSRIDVAFDLICPDALFALARVLQEGREKGRTTEGWKSIPTEDHLNHALMHIYGHLGGDRQEDHLQHAFCRLMMAWSTANTLPAKDEPQFKYVYLCYPYKDDPSRRTKEVVVWAARHFDPTIQFIIPHVVMCYMSESADRALILAKCRYLISKCDEVWVPDNDVGLTSGMREELAEADKLMKPIVRADE